MFAFFPERSCLWAVCVALCVPITITITIYIRGRAKRARLEDREGGGSGEDGTESPDMPRRVRPVRHPSTPAAGGFQTHPAPPTRHQLGLVSDAPCSPSPRPALFGIGACSIGLSGGRLHAGALCVRGSGCLEAPRVTSLPLHAHDLLRSHSHPVLSPVAAGSVPGTPVRRAAGAGRSRGRGRGRGRAVGGLGSDAYSAGDESKDDVADDDDGVWPDRFRCTAQTRRPLRALVSPVAAVLSLSVTVLLRPHQPIMADSD